MEKTVFRLHALIMLILLLSPGMVATQSRSLNDQTVINTQRLYDLERRMAQIERGGSELAGQTAARTTINEIRIDSLKQDIHDIRSVLVGVAVFVVTHLVGFVIYLLKNRITKV